MKNVAFDSSKDILILGGDNCDRGADSEHVLTYLDNPWVYSVQGNHESLFTGAYEEGWQGPYTNCLLQNGGMWVLGVDQAKLQDIYHVFKSLPTAIELITHEERIGVIHAQCPYNSWDEMLKMTEPEWKWDGDNTSQWARDIYDIGKSVYVKGVDRLLVGHTPTQSGCVEVLGNMWYCDLGSFFRNKISFVQIM
jgi:serine/threonine protein phosphatase 1